MGEGRHCSHSIAEFRDVRVSVGKEEHSRRLVSDLTHKIYPKDRLALIGPNGSGKTSILRVMRGELKCDAGFFHHRANFVSALIQNYRNSLFPWLSFRQNVELYQRSDRFNRDFFDESAAKLEIEKLQESRVFQLSGGEQQLLALCLTLAIDAELFLLDEPLSAVDFRRQGVAASIITSRIEFSNSALVCVTHSLENAVSVTNSALVLMDPALPPTLIEASEPNSYVKALNEIAFANTI